jgi:hypothetical protein
MCKPNATLKCQKGLKGKPGKCSPAQIRECHGDAAGHPCVTAKARMRARKR